MKEESKMRLCKAWSRIFNSKWFERAVNWAPICNISPLVVVLYALGLAVFPGLPLAFMLWRPVQTLAAAASAVIVVVVIREGRGRRPHY
jgi:hypothetical protein